MIVASCCVRALTAASGATAQPRCSGVVWRTLRDGTQTCPRTHSLIADYGLVRLRWSAWGGADARADGYLMCGGSGCAGTHPRSVRVKLSRRERCPDGVEIYARYDSWFYARHRRSLVGHTGYRIPCDGMTGGGNG